MVSKDELWKGVIEDLAEDFLRYFFSDVIHLIDFQKGVDFLDKELIRLFPGGLSSVRHADKLMKIWLKDGGEHWVLIHVEVQGYDDPNFAFRMFQYAYRIRDRFRRKVTALAIYTGLNQRFHFSEYRESFWGADLRYRFRSFSVIRHTSEELLRSDNVIGIVLEAVRQAILLSRKDDLSKMRIKTRLVRLLLKYSVDRKRIKLIIDFIKYYIRFDEGNFLGKFDEEVRIIFKTRETMGVQEVILKAYKTKGLEEGRAEGRAKGLAEGRMETAMIVIERGWKRGMEAADIADLVAMPVEEVCAIIEKLIKIREEE